MGIAGMLVPMIMDQLGKDPLAPPASSVMNWRSPGAASKVLCAPAAGSASRVSGSNARIGSELTISSNNECGAMRSLIPCCALAFASLSSPHRQGGPC